MLSNLLRSSIGAYWLAYDADAALYSVTLPVATTANTTLAQTTTSTFYLRSWLYISPLNISGILGILVVVFPSMRAALVEPSGWLYSSVFTTLRACGHAAIPLMLVLLGAQISLLGFRLRSDLRKSVQQTILPGTYPSYRWSHRAIFVLKLMILPTLNLLLLWLLVPLTQEKVLLRRDPVLLITLMILSVMPTSTRLWAMCDQGENFERPMASLLYWQYLFAWPVLFGWCMLILWLLQVLPQSAL